MTTYRKTMAEALKDVYLGENNLEKMRKASKGAAQTLKMKDGNLKMDSFTASAIMKIYDMINDKNKKTFEKMMKDGKKADIMKLQKFAMSKISSEYVPEEFEEEFELDEMKSKSYALVVKGEIVAVGSKADMMKMKKQKGGEVYMSPGAKVGDKAEEVELDESKKALKAKSEKSGVSVGILSKVYDRGMAAWKTGHRPGTTPQQWALARVNSFLTGGGARKADNDLWQQAKKQKEDLDEAKMSDIIKFDKRGMSTKDIAKKVGMDEGEVKALLSQPKDIQKAIMSLEEFELDEILTQRPRAGGGRHGKNVEMNLKVHSIIMQDYIKQGASKDKASKAAFKDVKAMGNREKQDIIKKGKSSLFYTESFDLAEDGHADVPSAVRQCKTVMEDATQILSKLMAMGPEDSLPTWWTNKLAVASNNMNKMRDYLLVSSEMKEELEEALDKDDEATVKRIVGKLKKASQAHAGQAKDLEKAMKEQPEHEITVGGYTTKFFYMCGSAQEVMKKNADVEGAEEITKLQDDFYKLEKDVMDAGSATDGQKVLAKEIYNKIMKLAGEAGLADDIGGYMKQHLDSVEKGDPKPGFGRTDMKEEVELDEASARADAMRAMRRGKSVDPADVDTDATDDDVKSASKNIMMQLRKSVSLRGNFPVEFMDKKKVKIPQKIAQAVLNKHNSFRKPMDKEKFQAKVSKSHRDLLSALKEEKETKLGIIHRQLKEK